MSETGMTAKEQQLARKINVGFWIYLMSDLVLFATLFATFMILRHATNGGVSGRDIFDLPFVFGETVILLTSSVSSGIAYLAATMQKRTLYYVMMALTIVLGLGFLAMELSEFSTLVSEGHSWQASAFLSAFFTLVGTHGFHIAVGLLWASVLVVACMKRGLTKDMTRKLGLFSLFWHFLDLVWIFIFTIVYLMGVQA